MRKGSILAVCTSLQSGLPKYPQESVRIAEFGFEGDFHCKPERRSFSKPGTFKPNDDRHLTVVAAEVLEELNAKFDLSLKAGDLAENITSTGLGNLSDIPDGSHLRIGRIILRVTEQNQPCKNLRHFHPLFIKEIYGKRGLLCSVVEGVGLEMKAGDLIEVV